MIDIATTKIQRAEAETQTELTLGNGFNLKFIRSKSDPVDPDEDPYPSIASNTFGDFTAKEIYSKLLSPF